MKSWIIGAAGAALFGLTSFTANAAPASGLAQMNESAQAMSAIEKAAYRQCWRQNGVRRCRWLSDGDFYGYYYGRPRAEEFPTGSTAWWRAMDYEGRGGHGRR